MQKWDGRFTDVAGRPCGRAPVDVVFVEVPLIAEMLAENASYTMGRYCGKKIVIPMFVPDESLTRRQRAAAVREIRKINRSLPKTILHEYVHWKNQTGLCLWEMGFNMVELLSFNIHDEISAYFTEYFDFSGPCSRSAVISAVNDSFLRTKSGYYKRLFAERAKISVRNALIMHKYSSDVEQARKKLLGDRFNFPLYHGALRVYYTYDFADGRKCVLDKLKIADLRSFYENMLTAAAEYAKDREELVRQSCYC